MGSLVAPLLGGVGVVVAAAAGPLVTGAIQNRRDARLSADLERNLERLSQLKAGQANLWTHEIAQLEVLVRSQLAEVAARQTRFVEHRRNWASLGAVAIIIIFAFPLLWLLTLPESWWSWTLFVLLLLLAIVLCAIGIYQAFNPPYAPAPEEGAGGG